jgi:hypothetical protein
MQIVQDEDVFKAGANEPTLKLVGTWELCILSRTQKSSSQNLLYQEMSTRSGSNLVLRVPINFYSYTYNNIY